MLETSFDIKNIYIQYDQNKDIRFYLLLSASFLFFFAYWVVFFRNEQVKKQKTSENIKAFDFSFFFDRILRGHMTEAIIQDIKNYFESFKLSLKAENNMCTILNDSEMVVLREDKKQNKSIAYPYNFFRRLFQELYTGKKYKTFFLNSDNFENLQELLTEMMNKINTSLDKTINFKDFNFFNDPSNFYFLKPEIWWEKVLNKKTLEIYMLNNDQKIKILKNHKNTLENQDINTNSALYLFLNNFLNITYDNKDFKKSVNIFNLNNYEERIDKVLNFIELSVVTSHTEKKLIILLSEKLKKIKDEFKEFQKIKQDPSMDKIFYFQFKLDYLIKKINFLNLNKKLELPELLDDNLNEETKCEYSIFLEYFNNAKDFSFKSNDILSQSFVYVISSLFLSIFEYQV
jgi:hypothetical protein